MSIPVSFDSYRHASFRKKWFYHILGNFFSDFCSIYCVTFYAAHPEETDTLLVGGEGWKCNYKNTIFQACSGIVCECRIFSTFWVTTFPVTPCLDFLFVIKHYFSSARDNLNKRPSHQVRVGPNWNWMLFSKLPYLLDAIWPIIATPDHFPVFRN